MKLSEIKSKPKSKDILKPKSNKDILEPELKQELEKHQWSNTGDTKYILNHPQAQPFRKPKVIPEYIYRAIFFDPTGMTSRERGSLGTGYGFIPYTSDGYMAEVILQNMPGDEYYYEHSIIVKKKFKLQDCLLDFGSLYDWGMDERELWMKETPYYSSFTRSEIDSHTEPERGDDDDDDEF